MPVVVKHQPLVELTQEVAVVVAVLMQTQTPFQEQAAQASSSLNTTHLYNPHLSTLVLASG
jgi:hypothetical protein